MSFNNTRTYRQTGYLKFRLITALAFFAVLFASFPSAASAPVPDNVQEGGKSVSSGKEKHKSSFIKKMNKIIAAHEKISKFRFERLKSEASKLRERITKRLANIEKKKKSFLDEEASLKELLKELESSEVEFNKVATYQETAKTVEIKIEKKSDGVKSKKGENRK